MTVCLEQGLRVNVRKIINMNILVIRFRKSRRHNLESISHVREASFIRGNQHPHSMLDTITPIGEELATFQANITYSYISIIPAPEVMHD